MQTIPINQQMPKFRHSGRLDHSDQLDVWLVPSQCLLPDWLGMRFNKKITLSAFRADCKA